MENLFRVKSKKIPIDYENNEEQDWIDYIHRNLNRDLDHDVPFPDSSWSYARHDSVFERQNGLKRSDSDLREEVNAALYEAKELDASNVKVEAINGNVILSGNVRSEELKVRAQKIAQSVEGVWKVINDLNVALIS